MGLFDKLGAGGGKITVEIHSTQVAAGGTLRGTLTFTGGKRAQKITALQVWLTRGDSTDLSLGKGEVKRDGGTGPIGDKLTVAGEMSAQAEQVYAFPFELPIPPALLSSRNIAVNGQPGPLLQPYRVWGTADIPGEIDKHGQSPDFEVTGGSQVTVTTR